MNRIYYTELEFVEYHKRHEIIKDLDKQIEDLSKEIKSNNKQIQKLISDNGTKQIDIKLLEMKKKEAEYLYTGVEIK